jgi:steroid delta-isomerase-like uncharacterized protein
MEIAIQFKPKSMSSAQYEDVLKKLEDNGDGNPDGRLYHFCYGDKNNLKIFGIWNRKDDFENFGQKLIPVLKQVGIEPGEIEVYELYSSIERKNQQNLSIAKMMYDYFNERKFNEAVKNVSDNVVIYNVAQDVQIKGKEGFLGFMNFWSSAFPDAKVEIKSMNVSGDKVITEFTGKGTHNGIFETPAGRIDPTGRKINIPFCEIFFIKSGLIQSSHLYFDVNTIIQQLGVIPEMSNQ